MGFSFTRALKAGNYQEAAKQTLDIVSANDPETGESAVLRGLANRRIERYNEIADEVGFDRINDFSLLLLIKRVKRRISHM